MNDPIIENERKCMEMNVSLEPRTLNYFLDFVVCMYLSMFIVRVLVKPDKGRRKN